MGDTLVLQDGWKAWDIQRAAENEQLDDEGKLERCLLHNPNTPQSSTIPEIHDTIKALPVHMLTIQPLLWPMGFAVTKKMKPIAIFKGGENGPAGLVLA